MRTIRRFAIGSVFKVAAVTYGLLFAVFGCLFLVLPGVLGLGMLAPMMAESDLPVFSGGVASVLIAYVAGIVLFSLLYGLIAAIGAVIYNLVAGWVGGIQVELE
ncbi:MAG: hypothetical protein NZP34_00010 [Caldilineales bacterium]|nr:hypothetical protein [Caldilineales bacterium]